MAVTSWDGWVTGIIVVTAVAGLAQLIFVPTLASSRGQDGGLWLLVTLIWMGLYGVAAYFNAVSIAIGWVLYRVVGADGPESPLIAVGALVAVGVLLFIEYLPTLALLVTRRPAPSVDGGRPPSTRRGRTAVRRGDAVDRLPEPAPISRRRHWRPRRERPPTAVLVAVVVAILAVGGGAVWVTVRQQNLARERAAQEAALAAQQEQAANDAIIAERREQDRRRREAAARRDAADAAFWTLAKTVADADLDSPPTVRDLLGRLALVQERDLSPAAVLERRAIRHDLERALDWTERRLSLEERVRVLRASAEKALREGDFTLAHREIRTLRSVDGGAQPASELAERLAAARAEYEQRQKDVADAAFRVPLDEGDPSARAHYRTYCGRYGTPADVADVESRLACLPFGPGAVLPLRELNTPPNERATDVEPPRPRRTTDRLRPLSYGPWRDEPLAGGVLVPSATGFTVHQCEKAQAIIVIDRATGAGTVEYTYVLPQLWWDRILRVIPLRDGASLYTARQLRRDMGLAAPAETALMWPARLFGNSFCLVGETAYRRGRNWEKRGAYDWGSTTWVDRLLGATWTHPDQLRVRTVPGTRNERFCAWVTDGRRGIIELGTIDVMKFDGQPNGRLELLAHRQAATLPFEIVPDGHGGHALLVVTAERVPRLLRPGIDGVVEIASGPPLHDGLLLGNLAWTNLDADDALEYVSLAQDESTRERSLVVLLESP